MNSGRNNSRFPRCSAGKCGASFRFVLTGALCCAVWMLAHPVRAEEPPPPFSDHPDFKLPTAEVAQAQPPQKAAPSVPPKPEDPAEKIPMPAEVKTTDLVEDLSKAQPVIPAPAEQFTLDLDTALRLAEAQNPNIALGRQAIQYALAQQTIARSMLLPTLRAGGNYHDHQGVLQTSFGEMRRVNSSDMFLGFGSRTVAAETLAYPGIQIYAHLGDAYFNPLVARQQVAVSRARSQAITNQILLDIAERYLGLLEAEAELSALTASEVEMNQIVQITESYRRTKQGRPSDAHRARTEALLLHNQKQNAEERVVVAAAELARLLNLDPAVRLRSPAAGDIAVVELVPPSDQLDQLIQRAVALRPELAALRAEVLTKEIQIRQEVARPWCPIFSLAFSAGTFGGGTNRTDLVPVDPSFGKFAARTDADLIAYWQLNNLGIGNLALQRERRSERDMANLEQTRMTNEVGREVVAAHALSEAHLKQVLVAQRRLDTAEPGFRGDLARVRAANGLPIEVLNSMDLLVQSRIALIRFIALYDRAQFQLFVALGQPPGQDAPQPQKVAPVNRPN